MPITIDSREPAHMPLLIRGLGIEAEVREMPCGDYGWESPLGPVLVERKEVGDLLGSFLSGSLDDQLRRCVEAASLAFLLIEGGLGEVAGHVSLAWRRSSGDDWQRKLDFDAIDNRLVAWQLRGVYIKHAPNPTTTHLRIASLYRWTRQKNHSELYLRPKRLPNLGRLSERAEVLAALPGIGTKRAVAVAAAAPLQEILGGWEPHQWAQHIGSIKQAEKLVAFLEEQP